MLIIKVEGRWGSGVGRWISDFWRLQQ